MRDWHVSAITLCGCLCSKLNVNARAKGLLAMYSVLSGPERKGFAALLKDKVALQKITMRYLTVRCVAPFEHSP